MAHNYTVWPAGPRNSPILVHTVLGHRDKIFCLEQQQKYQQTQDSASLDIQPASVKHMLLNCGAKNMKANWNLTLLSNSWIINSSAWNNWICISSASEYLKQLFLPVCGAQLARCNIHSAKSFIQVSKKVASWNWLAILATSRQPYNGATTLFARAIPAPPRGQQSWMRVVTGTLWTVHDGPIKQDTVFMVVKNSCVVMIHNIIMPGSILWEGCLKKITNFVGWALMRPVYSFPWRFNRSGYEILLHNCGQVYTMQTQVYTRSLPLPRYHSRSGWQDYD